MSDLWLVGQFGIVLELIGAAVGVWFAWKTKSTWENTAVIYGEIVFPSAGVHPQAEFVAGFQKQAWAFGLIGVGLALQFVGNFGK